MKLWYAVQTKPRREADAELNLRRQGFEVYLPRIQASRRRLGKWQSVIEPLFPRYLFVNVDPDVINTAPIRSTVGVSQLVRFGHTLVSVPGEVVDYLMSREDAQTGCYVRPGEKLEKGDPVEVLEGPLTGLRGVYAAASGRERVIVLLRVLGTVNRFNLKSAQVSRLPG